MRGNTESCLAPLQDDRKASPWQQRRTAAFLNNADACSRLLSSHVLRESRETHSAPRGCHVVRFSHESRDYGFHNAPFRRLLERGKKFMEKFEIPALKSQDSSFVCFLSFNSTSALIGLKLPSETVNSI